MGKRIYVYHLGDFDPSGVDAGDFIIRTLNEMCPRADIRFERLAINPEQIVEWNLPTRPTKKTDTRAKEFGDQPSCELDTIPPNMLRLIVEDAIKRHMPDWCYGPLMDAEKAERDVLLALSKKEGGLL